MKITLTGGTGFIGSHLTNLLEQRGHDLIILTRNPEKYAGRTNPKRSYRSLKDDMTNSVSESDAIINMAGENMIARRWTQNMKKRLMNSRVETTRQLVQAIEKADNRPGVMISASAAGFYGSKGDKMLTEKEPPGDDFGAEICTRWEAESRKAEKFGVRVVNPRFGIALERDGGALSKMLIPFYLCVGGSLGSGRQYFPWVHMRDLCQSIIFALQEDKIDGAFNVSSPNPVTMDEFVKTLGKVMNRPSFLRVPKFALKLVFGEGALATLASIRMQPEVLVKNGFKFEYPELGDALRSVVKK